MPHTGVHVIPLASRQAAPWWAGHVVCLLNEVTLKSLIKFFSLWIIVVQGLVEHPRVGVELSLLSTSRNPRWLPKWPPFIEKLL